MIILRKDTIFLLKYLFYYQNLLKKIPNTIIAITIWKTYY